MVEGELTAEPQYETDRARFLGRGRDIGNAAAMEGNPLSNTAGTVLDPIFALRYRVAVPPGEVARIAFWTVVAPSRSELIDVVDRHNDRNAYDRAKTLAWTQAQVQLRHLDVRADEAADFQRLAAPILYSDPRLRPSSDTIVRGAGGQSGLWPYGISGDRPIVVCRIDDVDDIDSVRQLLRAHEYWRMKQLGVDLVIINERGTSYQQDLQVAIETAVRASQSRPHFGEELAQGAVHVLRADLLTPAAQALILSVARVVLVARRGSIPDQIGSRPLPPPAEARIARRTAPLPVPSAAAPEQPALEFFNGLGGFDKDGAEYVTVLEGSETTPAPWINVIANSDFGFQVAAEGSGYTWCMSSRENQLTPWSNDPVSDPSGEAIFVRDDDTGDLWSPTAQPIRDGGTYIARHGRGYSRFEHTAQRDTARPPATRSARRSDQDIAAQTAQPLRPHPPPFGDGLCGMGARNLARRRRAAHHHRARHRERRDPCAQSLEHCVWRACRLRRYRRQADRMDGGPHRIPRTQRQPVASRCACRQCSACRPRRGRSRSVRGVAGCNRRRHPGRPSSLPSWSAKPVRRRRHAR